MRTLIFCLVILLATSSVSFAAQLTTVAEQSGWKKTGRYDEVIKLCHEFATAYPKQAQCQSFGVTPEGRPMMVLVATSENKKIKKPTIMFQGGIHAGEIDGKDAGFLILREILSGKILTGLLEKTMLVFVPVFNVDGHERFGAHNRPNQIGPEEMGWRTTAQNYNLNRDYSKADSPEMAAMLMLLAKWDPILYVDLHVTDGAQFQHDVSLIVDPSLEGPKELKAAGIKLRDAAMQKLRATGHLPLDFYPEFDKEDEPSSGFRLSIGPPRLSHFYWGTRNRIGVLVETHSWKDYATRVRATHDSLLALFEAAMQDSEGWVKAAQAADTAAKNFAGKPVILSYESTESFRKIDFQGFAYKRELSEISGQLQTSYDTTKPEVWKVPFHDELAPTLTVVAPNGGYVVPAAYAPLVVQKLKLHGISFSIIAAATHSSDLEVFRATESEFEKTSYEGHTTLRVKGSWSKEAREIPAGSVFIPIDQSSARLILNLFEPSAPDSLLHWGFFNNAFEKKEYMEPYVAEDLARKMLAKDEALKTEFNAKLADPEFAKDVAKRLEFFYRRHPSWDDRYGLYPIYRSAKKL